MSTLQKSSIEFAVSSSIRDLTSRKFFARTFQLWGLAANAGDGRCESIARVRSNRSSSASPGGDINSVKGEQIEKADCRKTSV